MLVLARQRDQTIIIGDDIEITVVDIRGDKVRLGINAPQSVSVTDPEHSTARRTGASDARAISLHRPWGRRWLSLRHYGE